MKNKGRMTDMKRTDEDRAVELADAYKPPEYGYNLSISLDEKDMAKLELDPNCEVGDEIEFDARAKVTAVHHSDREGSSGPSHRIELQITHLSMDDDDSGDSRVVKASRRYSGSKGE